MLILICKDGATQVPREVKDLDEAAAVAALGMPVLVQNEDGTTTPLEQAIVSAGVGAFVKEVEAHVTGGRGFPESEAAPAVVAGKPKAVAKKTAASRKK
jgi:hypothetical protein